MPRIDVKRLIVSFAIPAFGMGLGLGFLGTVISFTPFGEVYCFGLAAALTACGLLLPDRRVRWTALSFIGLFALYGVMGYYRSVKHQQLLWDRESLPRAKDRKD